MPITKLVIALLSALPATSGLTPTECVVVYNSAATESGDIARYYAEARGIPADHLLGISLPRVETLVRRQYDTVVRPAVRDFIGAAEWGKTVRCLVTCYGVPLRIAAVRPTHMEREHVKELTARLTVILDAIRLLIEEIRSADVDTEFTTQPKTETTQENPKAIEKLHRQYVEEQTKLAARHRGLTGSMLFQARKQTFDFVRRATGDAGILDHAPADADRVDPSSAVRIRMLRERVQKQIIKTESLTAYGSAHQSFEQAVPLISDTRGLFGVAAALRDRIRAFESKDSMASFDSELALVLWDDYAPAGWQANNLNDSRRRRESAPRTRLPSRRTLMVARLDAPTPDIVRRMIDDAIRIERTGLTGTFYIDARGVKQPGLVQYDRDLLDLAHIVRTRTKMPVVLDIQPPVFQPGRCSDAALYCGWYSLSKYVDAFDFVPGAVAVHIASFELVSLRNPNKPGWCPELLKDGVAATFGATSEPFLQAFPLPTEFFCRLLTGKYTLVEAFSQTKFYNSWQLSLLGDPLYNPFKTNPQLSEDWDRRSSFGKTPTEETK